MGGSRLDLGVGVVALGGLDLIWGDIADLVEVVEVEPQTLWRRGGPHGFEIEPDALSSLRGIDRPLLSHGVGFPVGGMVAPDQAGVRAAAASARTLGASHWSEHLSFNRSPRRAAGTAGFLLPPFQSEEVVEAAVANIACYQLASDLPFLVETPANYLRRAPGELRDGEFVREVVRRADCGVLLDLHNVYVNARNGRQGVREFVDDLDLDRVLELHLAGGFELDGYYLDAHWGAAPDALLELAADVVPRLPNLRAIVFETVPESLVTLGAPGLREVLGALRGLAELDVAAADRAARPPWPTGSRRDGEAAPVRAAVREAALLAYTTRASDVVPDDDPGARILRILTDQARLSLITGEEPERLRFLLEQFGRAGTDELLEGFLAAAPPQMWPDEEARSFVGWFEESFAAELSAARAQVGAGSASMPMSS